jgi:hypothetical protein
MLALLLVLVPEPPERLWSKQMKTSDLVHHNTSRGYEMAYL